MSWMDETPWYDVPREDATEVARCVMMCVRDIERRQFTIHEGHKRHARMYGGYLPSAMSWTAGPGGNQRVPFAATKAVVRAVCDTAQALITKFRPKATIVTDGADWKIQQSAEDLDRFMVGAYEIGGVYRVAPVSFHDTTKFGTGLWKFVERGTGEDWHIAVERVLPDNFIVDEEECPESPEPENTYHRTLVSSAALVRKYGKDDPGLKFRINASAAREWPNRAIPEAKSVLVEAVHVDRDGGPGRRVLCTDGAVLEDEVWPFPWHPYEFLWWQPPTTGFYGDGVAYRQYGLQERVSYMYRWVQRVHDLFGTPVAWVDPVGGPPTMQMSNEIGAIVTCHRPPVFQPRQMIAAEVYNWIDRLIEGGHADEGMNMMTAGGQLPPGVETAPAQREWSFKEGNRFAPVSQRWENAIAVGTCRKMIALYQRRAETGPKPRVKWADRKLLHVIDWPDIDHDAYLIRPEASSLDSLSPAARIQAAIELSQTNWIAPAEGRELMGHPDLKASDDLANAPRKYAEQVLHDIVHGEFVEVDDKADLQILHDVVSHGRLLCKVRRAPPKIVDALDDYLERLERVSNDAAAAVAAQQAQMGQAGAGGPPGQPGPMSLAAQQGRPLPFAGG